MATVDYVHHLAFPKLSDSEVEVLGRTGDDLLVQGRRARLPGRATRPAFLRRRVGRDRDRGRIDATSRRRSSSTARASSPATSRC